MKLVNELAKGNRQILREAWANGRGNLKKSRNEKQKEKEKKIEK